MSEASVQLRVIARRGLHRLRFTPVHPQWLAHRLRRHRDHWLATRASGDALDVGCADGSIRRGLQMVRSYVGLDYPGTAILMYGTRPEVFGDAASLPFADSCFDTVLLLDVAEHLPDPETAFVEACRVLRPGGRLLVTIPFAYPLHDMPTDYQRLTESGLRYRLARAGLKEVVVEEHGGGVEAAALAASIVLAQGAIDSIAERSWRALLLPVVMVTIPVINLLGWVMARLLPAPGLLPGAYFVEAWRG